MSVEEVLQTVERLGLLSREGVDVGAFLCHPDIPEQAKGNVRRILNRPAGPSHAAKLCRAQAQVLIEVSGLDSDYE